MHGDGLQLPSFEGTRTFTEDPDWTQTQRCEINTRLDGVSRCLAYSAHGDTDEVKLQKAWATRVLLNKRGSLAAVEAAYAAASGRGLYESPLSEKHLLAALRREKLDCAYPRFRMVLWQQIAGPGVPHEQTSLFVATWAALRSENAFADALARLKRGGALGAVLSDTLRVKSEFVSMVLARDLAVLLPHLVSQADVDATVVVGKGAA